MFSDFCLSSLLICITVVITGDRPTGLYIAYNYLLMCTVGINAVREMWFSCWSCGRAVNLSSENIHLVSWSLTSLFSTNMAISETKNIHLCWNVMFGAMRWRCRHYGDEVLGSYTKKIINYLAVWHKPVLTVKFFFTIISIINNHSKKTLQFKTAWKDDSSYITQLRNTATRAQQLLRWATVWPQ